MRVAIIGAGAVGRSVARDLLDSGHEVLIIERRRTSYRPDRVPEATWMLADACEVQTLRKAGVETCDALLAATADDQANLVVCMHAKTEFGVPRVLARVTNPANEPLFTQAWGVDVAVSTPRAMVSGFEEAVTVGEIITLMTLQRGRADILEVRLPDDTRFTDRAVGDLALPEGATVLAVVRAGSTIAGRPDVRLRPGDGLLLAASADVRQAVRELLEEPAGHLPSHSAADRAALDR